MTQGRLTLDNPVFANALRTSVRSAPVYQRREMSQATMQDVMLVRVRNSATTNKPIKNATPQKPTIVKKDLSRLPNNYPRSLANNNIINIPQSANRSVFADPTPMVNESPDVRPSKYYQNNKTVTLLSTLSGFQNLIKIKAVELTALHKKQMALYVMASFLFMCGAFVAIGGLRANQKVEAQVNELAQSEEIRQKNDGSSTGSVADEDETPTLEMPTEKTVSSYVVAPNMPKYIDIPELSVHARIRPVSVDRNNRLKAPSNRYDTGWYDASARPGESGAMLIDGHSNVLGKSAVFAKLGKLSVGDTITITKGDDTKVSYKVNTVEVVAEGNVDMSSMMVSADPNKPGLNVITCAGRVIPGTRDLDKRVLVRAVLE